MSQMSVRDAMEKIYDKEYGVRITAFRVLREANTPEARQALIRAAQETSDLVQQDAIIALREIGGDELLPAFVGLLGSDNHHTSQSVARAIAQYGKHAVPLLLPALSSDRRRVRLNAAQTLLELGEHELAVPVLLSLLFSGDPTRWPYDDADNWVPVDVINTLLWVMFKPPSQHDLDALGAALERGVVTSDELEAVVGKKNIDRLLPYYVDGLINSNRAAQEGAAWCIWNEHGYSGEQPLYGITDYVKEDSLPYWPRKTTPSEEYLQALTSETRKVASRNMVGVILHSEYWQSRRAAAWILSHTGFFADPVELLPALSDAHHEVGWMVARALQDATWSEPARVALRDLLKNEDETVRWIATWLLGRLADQGSVYVLTEHLRTELSPHVRMQAAYALGQIGDKSSLVALKDTRASDSSGLVVRVADYSAFLLDLMIGGKENDKVKKAIHALERGDTIAERVNAAITMKQLKDLATLPALLSGLRDDALIVREAVIEALAAICHPIAALPLVEAIRWEEPVFLRWNNGSDERYEDVRSAMGDALQQIVRVANDVVEGLQEKLGESLGDYDTRHHFTIAQVKTEMGKGSVEALIEDLQNENSAVRYYAAFRLGELGDPSTVPHLTEILNEDEGIAPSAAITALATIGTADAIHSLALCTYQQSSIWQRDAVRLLERMGQQAIDILQEALQGDDAKLRDAARVTLMKLGVFDDMATVLTALQSDDDVLKHAAVEQIAVSGDESMVLALVDAMDGANDEIRGEIVLSIGKIGSVEHIPYLAGLLQTGSKLVQTRAICAIANIGGEQALDTLTSALDHEDFFIRQGIISVLGEAGGSAAIPLLSRLVVEEERQLSDTAATVLWQMETPEARGAREEALKQRKSRKDEQF